MKLKFNKLEELEKTLMSQRNHQSILDKGIEKALSIPFQTLRSRRPKTNKKFLPFISKYNPINPNLFPIIINLSLTFKVPKA